MEKVQPGWAGHPNGWATCLNYKAGWVTTRRTRSPEGNMAPKKWPRKQLDSQTIRINWQTYQSSRQRRLFWSHKGRASGQTPKRQVRMKILGAGAIKGKLPYLYILVVVLCGRSRRLAPIFHTPCSRKMAGFNVSWTEIVKFF